MYTIGHSYFQSPWTTNLKNTVSYLPTVCVDLMVEEVCTTLHVYTGFYIELYSCGPGLLFWLLLFQIRVLGLQKPLFFVR